jgi:hypothetical protein
MHVISMHIMFMLIAHMIQGYVCHSTVLGRDAHSVMVLLIPLPCSCQVDIIISHCVDKRRPLERKNPSH